MMQFLLIGFHSVGKASKLFFLPDGAIFSGLVQWRMQNVTDGWAWIKSRWAWIYGCSEIKAGFPDNVVS